MGHGSVLHLPFTKTKTHLFNPTSTMLRRRRRQLPPATAITATFSSDSSSLDLRSDVENVYRILRRHHEDPSKLHLLLSSVPLRPRLVELVLRRCGSASSLAFPFFSWASRHPHYLPSPDTHSSLLRVLSKSRNFAASWALLQDLRLRHPDLLTPDLFLVLVRRFASSRMLSRALQVLDEMPSYGCQPDSHLFASLLDALCKNGSVRDAAKLFDEMRERFPPTIRHFTALLYGWCREGKITEAKFVLVQMRRAGLEPDLIVFNTLLSGYTMAGRIEDGYELLREMRRKGFEPNVVSYTTLIQALCARERMDEAMTVFAEMRRSRCRADVVTYTTLISGFCKWGKTGDAYELLEDMSKEGCMPNASTYACVMVAHEKKEKLEECLELIEKMKRSGCRLDLNVYNVVIRLSCKLGELKQAVTLWEEVEASKLSPGLDTFVILVNGFTEQGALIEACGYFKEMISRGLWSTPHYGTLKELLNSLLRADKLQLAEEVWGCLVEKGCELNVYAWTIWIHALFSKKHVKVACLYCINMMEDGLMPQADTFAKLMRGLKKLYNRHVAAEITEKVRKMAAQRKVSFKMYKRRGVRLLDEKAKAKIESAEGLRRRRAARRRGREQASSSQLE